MSNSKKKFTYKDAGVDIEAGDKMVESIKGMVKETHSDAVLSNIGGFGGFFRPDLSSYEDPVFVKDGRKSSMVFRKAVDGTIRWAKTW